MTDRRYYVSVTLLVRKDDATEQHFRCIGGKWNPDEWSLPHQAETGLIREMVDHAEAIGGTIISHSSNIYFDK